MSVAKSAGKWSTPLPIYIRTGHDWCNDWTCNPQCIYMFYCSWIIIDDIVACHHQSLHILWLHWLLALPYSHQIYILQVFRMEMPISIETRKYLCSKTSMFSCIICIWYDMYIMRVRSEAGKIINTTVSCKVSKQRCAHVISSTVMEKIPVLQVLTMLIC